MSLGLKEREESKQELPIGHEYQDKDKEIIEEPISEKPIEAPEEAPKVSKVIEPQYPKVLSKGFNDDNSGQEKDNDDDLDYNGGGVSTSTESGTPFPSYIPRFRPTSILPFIVTIAVAGIGLAILFPFFNKLTEAFSLGANVSGLSSTTQTLLNLTPLIFAVILIVMVVHVITRFTR